MLKQTFIEGKRKSTETENNVLLPFAHSDIVSESRFELWLLSKQSSSLVVKAVWVATENHLRNNIFNIQGCPIMYFTSLGDNLLMYDGDRTEDTINFLQNNRYKISKPDSVKDEI
ncbi:hypothetical protein Prudu_013123 [Prunus dulcis]|uniref:Uncharacterized protein n=1 Tax=Prunus dulcis TaxID=3755 RepID=A0A4Y1REG2_PRUDU|nr:hypothetical protein Prudu_013123 [Prunus dulcis]